MYSSTKLNSIHSDILFCPIPDTVNEKKTLLSEVITRAKDAFRLKSYQDADLLYSRAITITPDDTYYANRSLIRLKLNNIGEANRDANKVIELNPDWAKGYFRKAQILEKQEEYKDAIHYYKLSLARETDSKIIDSLEKKLELLTIVIKDTREPKLPSSDKRRDINLNNNVNTYKVNDANNDDIDLTMRGYKIKEDGSKTTFFNNDLSNDVKILIGDITPKRIS